MTSEQLETYEGCNVATFKYTGVTMGQSLLINAHQSMVVYIPALAAAAATEADGNADCK